MALFTSLARAASKLGTRITAVGTSARAALLGQTIVSPKVTPGRLLTGRLEIERGLVEAIKERQPVRFMYTDKIVRGSPGAGVRGSRVGNPHALFRGENGGFYLHMYIDPQSASQSRSRGTATAPGWRTFLLNRITDLEPLNPPSRLFGGVQRFPIAPGYNPSFYRRVGIPVALAS